MSEEQLRGINVYPTDTGVALEVIDGEKRSVALLSPDEAGRIASSLLTSTVMFQFNTMMMKVAEMKEFDRIRQNVDLGAGIPDLSKLKGK